jgi:glycosyltransferase involved in cell wall biosynthesis
MSARPLHIGLNLIFLVPGETGGMEVYARELIATLTRSSPEVRFTAFINRETASSDAAWQDMLPTVTVPVNARNRVQWVLGEQALLPRLAHRERVDLLHSLASTAPAWGPFKRLTTVHDLIYARFPEAHGGVRALGMRALVPLAVRGSHRLIADSQSTKRDLIELLKAPSERIDVVPLGFGVSRRSDPPPAAEVRKRLGIDKRGVLLSLSAKRPHKNLMKLIDAVATIPAQRRPLLLLPGYETWHEAQLRQRVQELGLAQDVRFMGWVSREELEGLWAIADAFVYPSLYEGFGLPVLEAMARGVPVACANASSLPEVAGDAALLFDPHSEGEIATAIQRLLSEPRLAQQLREAGVQRAARFTWERTARLTLASYNRALAGAGDAAESATRPLS